jgi:hypothetical protein
MQGKYEISSKLDEAQKGLESVLDLLLDLGLQARRRERADEERRQQRKERRDADAAAR